VGVVVLRVIMGMLVSVVMAVIVPAAGFFVLMLVLVSVVMAVIVPTAAVFV
jgi:uncharacterized membrane protein